MRRIMTVVLTLAATLMLTVTSALADANNAPNTFNLVLPPNTAEAPNGDRVSVAGSGTFSVHPKTVVASGTFTHTDMSGTVVGTGTWAATSLLSFEFYGCGVLTFPDPDVMLPPNFCGGALRLRVVLTPTGTTLELKGVLSIFCIIGPQTPESHDDPPEEGIRLVVPGVLNFNKIVPPNMNVFIKTTP
jgi:hypothetical protein